jgi:hypothetical protein
MLCAMEPAFAPDVVIFMHDKSGKVQQHGKQTWKDFEQMLHVDSIYHSVVVSMQHMMIASILRGGRGCVHPANLPRGGWPRGRRDAPGHGIVTDAPCALPVAIHAPQDCHGDASSFIRMDADGGTVTQLQEECPRNQQP